MTSLGSLRHWPLAPLLYGSYLCQEIRLKLLDLLKKSKCPAISTTTNCNTRVCTRRRIDDKCMVRLSINGPVKPSKSFGKVVGMGYFIWIFFNLSHSHAQKPIVTPHVESLRLMGNPSTKYAARKSIGCSKNSISIIYYRFHKFQKYLGIKNEK